MTINQLEYFLAVCEHLNFTQAARQCYISQTAISQQIKALEKELGVVLFARNNRHVELTPAGRMFVDDARAILRRTNDAIIRARSTDAVFTGHVNLGFVKGFEKTILSDLISDFRIQYPNISFNFTRENVAPLYDGVLDHSLDVIINLRYSMDDLEEIDYHVVKQYPLLAVMPPSHPLSHLSSIKRSELKDYPLVDITKNSNRYGETKTIMGKFLEAGFMPKIAYISDDIETSILAVAAGLGYALLPEYITAGLTANDKVIAVPLENEEQRMTVIAAWHKDMSNPAADKFIHEALIPAIEAKRF